MEPELTAAPRVSIIVVNYNGGETIGRCLDSLLRCEGPSREIFVVDNASTDGSLASLERRQVEEREWTLLPSDRNLGYAGGVNLALPLARGEYVAVLNMDLTVDPGWLGPLVDFMDGAPGCGAVNPLVVLADGLRINALGQNVHVTGLGFNRGLGQPVERAGKEPVAVSGIQGAAFLTRRALLERLGGIDASGFLYHEDVNLSWLLRMTGHELSCVPASVVRHDYFLSMYPEKFHLLERNRLALLLSYPRRTSLLCLSPLLLLTEVFAWTYCLLRGVRFLGAKARSYLWVFRHRSAIASRYAWAQSIRTVPDGRVFRSLRWSYSWGQFLTLGLERGPSGREPAGGLRTGSHTKEA